MVFFFFFFFFGQHLVVIIQGLTPLIVTVRYGRMCLFPVFQMDYPLVVQNESYVQLVIRAGRK